LLLRSTSMLVLTLLQPFQTLPTLVITQWLQLLLLLMMPKLMLMLLLLLLMVMLMLLLMRLLLLMLLRLMLLLLWPRQMQSATRGTMPDALTAHALTKSK
jgi:hypothetical protein